MDSPALPLDGLDGPEPTPQVPPVDTVPWDPDGPIQPETIDADLDAMLQQAAPRLIEAHTRDTGEEFEALREEIRGLIAATFDLRDLSAVRNDDARQRVGRALPRFVALGKVRALRKSGVVAADSSNEVYAHLLRETLPWVREGRPASAAERESLLYRMTQRTFDAESDAGLRALFGQRLERQVEQAVRAAGYVRFTPPERHIDLARLPVGAYATNVIVDTTESDLVARTGPSAVLLTESKVATDETNSRRRIREIKEAHAKWQKTAGRTTVAVLDGAFDHAKVHEALADGVAVLCAPQLSQLSNYLRRSLSSARSSDR